MAGAQRAVGEVMITRERDVIDIMGVAGFVSKIERFRPWLSRMEELIRTKPSDWDPGERQRLQDARAALGEVATGARSSLNLPG